MTADKPEAGRTCEPTCGSLEWCEHLATGVYYCTPGCAEARKPLNPDPRPVERCSCPEALRYKAALEQLLRDVAEAKDCSDLGACEHNLHAGYRNCRGLDYIERIARRALALGGEET